MVSIVYLLLILFKSGLSDISLCKYCLIKCTFLTAPEKRFYSPKKNFFLQIKKFENGSEKKFLDLKFFPLILAENPLFFPDFPDWKKSSKFSLISLIGGKPVVVCLSVCLSRLFSSVRYSSINTLTHLKLLMKIFKRTVPSLKESPKYPLPSFSSLVYSSTLCIPYWNFSHNWYQFAEDL